MDRPSRPLLRTPLRYGSSSGKAAQGMNAPPAKKAAAAATICRRVQPRHGRIAAIIKVPSAKSTGRAEPDTLILRWAPYVSDAFTPAHRCVLARRRAASPISTPPSRNRRRTYIGIHEKTLKSVNSVASSVCLSINPRWQPRFSFLPHCLGNRQSNVPMKSKYNPATI